MKYCMKCNGRKQLYKVGSIYSLTDTGGNKVDCPMCKGEGKHVSIDETLYNLQNDKQLEKLEKLPTFEKTKKKGRYKREFE